MVVLDITEPQYAPLTHWLFTISEIHPKSHQNYFEHNISFSCPIILKFCTDHSSCTAVFCAKFQNDWIIIEHKDKLFLEGFAYKMSFKWISSLALTPGYIEETINEARNPSSGAVYSTSLSGRQGISCTTSREHHCYENTDPTMMKIQWVDDFLIFALTRSGF